MHLCSNEIKNHAQKFSNEWADETKKRAEIQIGFKFQPY